MFKETKIKTIELKEINQLMRKHTIPPNRELQKGGSEKAL